MNRTLSFTAEGWEGYLYWQQHDKAILKRINTLLKDCQRDPFGGKGKPELLKHELAGAWSRRITEEHRLVYLVVGDEVRIIGCRHHY